MRQWRIAGDGSLNAVPAARPSPAPGQVRVDLAAAGVNRADILQRKGLYPAPHGAPADVPGLEFSGVVADCGTAVTEWRPGDRVMGLVPGGAYSESLCVDAAELLPVPPGMDIVVAGGVPEPFLTAWRALETMADLRAGETAVVRPGTAAVGQAAVQIAAVMGARVVATSRDPSRLVGLPGMDAVTPLTEADSDAAERLFPTEGEGADVLVDMLGGGGALRFGAGLLRPGGRLIGLGLMAGVREELPLASLLGRGLRLAYMTMRSMSAAGRAALVADAGHRLVACLQAGRLEALRCHRYGFGEAPAAMEALRTGRHGPGRVVLDLAEGA